jgi:hypothetical protein
MIMFVAAFAILLMIDYRFFQTALIARKYCQTRLLVSVIVIV